MNDTTDVGGRKRNGRTVDVIGDAQTPLLMHVTEAARMLSVSRSHLYELISEGRVPVVRLGKSIRVPRAAIEALAASAALARPAAPAAGIGNRNRKPRSVNPA